LRRWIAGQEVLRFERSPVSRVYVEMAHQVPLQIRQRLAEVVQDLKNAVGQQAAKDYLTRISSEEPIEVEPGAEPCDDSWMEFINNKCITNTSSPVYPTPLSSCGHIEEPPVQIADSHRDADSSRPATYLRTSADSITEEGCPMQRQGSTTESKRGIYNDDALGAFVENIPRRNLLDCLKIHWEAMKTEGIFTMPSREVFTWTLDGNSTQIRRLHYHLVLRHLDVEHDLYQWRRSIAELRNLDGYTSFLAEAQAQQTTCTKKRHRGETNSSKAHKEYLAHIYADRTPHDYLRIKRALKKDLRHGRRWSILVNGFHADEGDIVPGLGSGLLLLCGAAMARKM